MIQTETIRNGVIFQAICQLESAGIKVLNSSSPNDLEYSVEDDGINLEFGVSLQFFEGKILVNRATNPKEFDGIKYYAMLSTNKKYSSIKNAIPEIMKFLRSGEMENVPRNQIGLTIHY